MGVWEELSKSGDMEFVLVSVWYPGVFFFNSNIFRGLTGSIDIPPYSSKGLTIPVKVC